MIGDGILDVGRIARNAACLYLRNLVTAVSRIIVVRIVLRALGVDGYGMVAAVFAVTSALAFLNGVLHSTAQRFLSRECVRRSRDESSASFSIVFMLSLALSACVVLGGETVGLWFVRERLSIPDALWTPALVVYQAGLARVVVCVLTLPYSAQVNAVEKMGFFAVTSVVEGALAVLAAIAVSVMPVHRPETFAGLSLTASVVVLAVSVGYVRCLCPDLRLVFKASWNKVGEQIGYFFWSTAHALGTLLNDQGVAILVNLHAGVTGNASLKVGTEVGGHLYGLYGSLQQAYFPQMVKLWADDDRRRLWSLVVAMSRWSVLVTAVFALPIVIYAEPVLRCWLGADMPPSVVPIVRCLAVCRLLEAAVDPLHSAVMATGRIAVYEVGLFLTYVIGFVGAWMFLANGFAVWMTAAALTGAMFVNLVYHLVYLRMRMGFDVRWLIDRHANMLGSERSVL